MLTLLNDLVRRTRQHHAIEHATLHVLSARWPQSRFSGYSDPLGFTIYGDANDEQVRRAVGDALLRLQAGQTDLAIHPNCGTNIATSAILATMAARIVGSGRRSGPDRFAIALLFVTLALIAAKPLGRYLQGFTTLADVADRWVAEVRPVQVGSMRAVRVIFD